MMLALLRSTLLRGQCRELKLTALSGRSRDEVRVWLGRSAEQVEEVLKDHARRTTGHLPADWALHVQRKQIQGDGSSLPELVSYAYDGVYVIDVWTYIERDALHVLMRRATRNGNLKKRSSGPSRAPLAVWSPASAVAQLVGPSPGNG